MALLRGVNKLSTQPHQAASLAAGKPGEMASGLDLYGMLVNAANRTHTLDDFADSLVSSLNAALGQNNYVVSLALAKDGSGSGYATYGNKLANAAVWCGDAGVLPGVVANYSVMVAVFTS